MAKPRSPLARWLTRRVSYPVEAALLGGFWRLCGALSLDRASALGGWIGRTLGPLLPGDRVARRNLALVMPELDAAQRDAIVRGMWDNLGRTMAEYPHLEEIARHRTERIGWEHIERLRDDGMAGLIVSAHFANWEAPTVAFRHSGLDFALVYRAPNNPLADALLSAHRGGTAERRIPKGPDGARLLMKAVAAGAHIGMLVDQKMNDGLPARFFGRMAMTAPAAARLALRRKLPLVLARGERLGGAHFRLTITPPLDLPDNDAPETVTAVMERINDTLEDWIRQRPADWLWLHRRWPE